jgi:cytochrome b involved in lipid metabolism
MSNWTVALLATAIAFLVSRHPALIMDYLPTWLRPATQKSGGEDTVDEVEPEAPVEIQVIEEDEALTPKGRPMEAGDEVPSLVLNEGQEKQDQGKPTIAESPSSTRDHSAMPPPPVIKPTSPVKSAGGLMPPPPRPSLAPPPSSASSLRAPTNGPLPNRGPPSNSQQRVSGGLSANGAVPVPNPRGKVLLSPGHSPMDWAALTKRENLSGVKTFQRVTPSMLKSMTGRKGKPAWSSWQNKVYNITPYLDFHPGGKAELMKAAGRDGTKLFMDVHPWVNWENMLGSCLVGVMVSEDHGVGEGLEALD